MLCSWTGGKPEEGFKAAEGWTAVAAKRVFLEVENNAKAPTFAVDFYKPGQSPGVSVVGIVAGPAPVAMAVVYRVHRSKITGIWCGEDTEGVAANDAATEEMVCASAIYQQALEVMDQM